MTHALTTTLSLLIFAEGRQMKLHFDDTGFEHDIQRIIATVLDAWIDEKKADLYALIVESVQAGMPLRIMEKKINTALLINEGRYGR